MVLVKNYKGVDIYVTRNGEFYCDVTANSSDYKNKTFQSNKIQSIEKAIDNYQSSDIDGDEYYEIASYRNIFKKIKVIKKIGNRLFFDDGTETGANRFDIKPLYNKEIENSPDFNKIKELTDELVRNDKLVSELYNKNRLIRNEIDAILKNFKKVKF